MVRVAGLTRDMIIGRMMDNDGDTMKYLLITAALLTLTACTMPPQYTVAGWAVSGTAGNPNNQPYADGTGGVAAAKPAP